MNSDQPVMPSSVETFRNELTRQPASQCSVSSLVIFTVLLLGSPEPFGHQVSDDSGRVAIEGRGRFVALLFVKAARLDRERVQRYAGAAAPAPLLLGHRQEPAAEPVAA